MLSRYKWRMQRLFTTFPNGWPGAALLLLRIATSLPVFGDALSILLGDSNLTAAWMRVIEMLPAAVVLAGIWTPAAALLQSVIELYLAIAMPEHASLHLTRSAIVFALAGLGPGAWSLDSRLYGRKRIHI